MPAARVRAVRVVTTTVSAIAVVGAIGVAPASADKNGQGIGIEYATPVQYIQICGDNQDGDWTCTNVEPVHSSSTNPPYQTASFVDGSSDLIYGANPPKTAPQWWWQGTVKISTWSSYPAVSTGDTVCTVAASQANNWQKCLFIIPILPTPSPPSGPPSPPSTPGTPPASPTQSPPLEGPSPIGASPTLTLRASPDKLHDRQRLRLRGTLSGVPTAAGIVLELQARDGRTGRWKTFAVVLTHTGGGFSYDERFARAPGTWWVRATLPPQAGDLTAASHAVHVRVTGL